jgi:adenine-specific DNA methylase
MDRNRRSVGNLAHAQDVEELLTSPNGKRLGAYYTPPAVVESLIRWAVTTASSRVLDPSCGDGRFLSTLRNAVGVDIDPVAVAAARSQRSSPVVYSEDFFKWAPQTSLRFDAAIGNPPFIRYQRFSGETRSRALELCRNLGIDLTALASSWAPFIVGSSGLLAEGGRIGFVVPLSTFTLFVSTGLIPARLLGGLNESISMSCGVGDTAFGR